MARLAVMTMTAPVMSRMGWRRDVEPERKSQERENTGRRSWPELTARLVVRRLARRQRMWERDGMVLPRASIIRAGVGLGAGWPVVDPTMRRMGREDCDRDGVAGDGGKDEGSVGRALVDLTSDPGWSPRAGDDRADQGSTGGPHVRPWVVTACRGRSGRPGKHWWTSRPTLGGHRVPGRIGPIGPAGRHWWTSRPTLGGHPVPGTIGPAGEALVDLTSDPGWSPRAGYDRAGRGGTDGVSWKPILLIVGGAGALRWRRGNR